MNIKYEIAGLVLLGLILLIIFFIRRNQKDKKDFEKETSQSELKPEKHDKEKP